MTIETILLLWLCGTLITMAALAPVIDWLEARVKRARDLERAHQKYIDRRKA